MQDLRYALRRLLRSPGFTVVAVLSLALGIGANTAMFSVVNAVLIRGLPLRAPDELVEVYTSDADGYPYSTFSHPDYTALRAETDVFQGVVATRTFLARLDRGGRPETAFGELISWDYFDVLGVPMALGRSFTEEEDRTPGTHRVVILGNAQWRNEYAADPNVLGTSVRLNGRSFTVVGVAPAAFRGSMSVLVTGFYAPLMMTEALMAGDLGGNAEMENRGSRSTFVKARLAPGVSVDQANAALAAFAARLGERYPESNGGRSMSALPTRDVALHPIVDRALVPVAALLLVAVGLVLLVACANLASFLLARAEDRRKEVSLRLALGAGRWALVRQLLFECALLAVLGGALGALLARWTMDLLMSFRPPIPIPVTIDVSLDGTVLAFTAAVSLAAALAFGLVPALQATNPHLMPALMNDAAAPARPGRFRLRSAVVVLQVTFSVVLLIGAGLFMRGLGKARRIDPGFDIGPGAVVWPMVELSGYATEEQMRDFYRTVEERLLAHPDIERVALADRLPLGVAVQTHGFLIPGAPSARADGVQEIDNAHVSPSYFDAMGVPILRGRAFSEADIDQEPVVVVSEAFVARFFPGGDAVGQTIEDGVGNPVRIVGIARDTKVRTLGEVPRPYVYQLLGQPWISTQILVRGRATEPDLLAAARGVLNEIDPDLVLLEAKTMNEHLALMLFPPRIAALLLSAFGSLALALAAIGIYGVVSHAVARRTREMGIRMSLGATDRDVILSTVGGAMRLVGVGGAVGILLSAALTWAIQRFLFGVGARDLGTFAGITLLLGAVALVAAWLPARRVTALDPLKALRTE